jgi:hypothetical protein
MDFENYYVTENILTAVADFNGDGRPDIVGSSIRTNDLIVVENLTGTPVETKVCIGSDISLSTDVGGSTYQWQEDSGSGFSNISDNAGLQGTQTATLVIKSTPASWNTYRFRCITGNLKSTTYQLKVTGPIKPGVTASVPSLQFCKNGPVTFSATCINDGGVAPIYQWQINEQTVYSTDLNDPDNPGNIFTTSGLHDNDRVRVIVNSGEQCSLSQKDTSAVFIMIAHGAVPSVSIAGPPASTVTCDGTPATFVATPSNGGTSPLYQWMLNGANVGGNDPVLTAVVPINCELHVIMTSNSSDCNIVGKVTSNSLRPVIHENLVNDVSIYATVTSVCKDQSVTFLSNAWSDPTASFQWQVNDVTVSTQSWYYMASSFADGSEIKLLKTTGQPCTLPITATSNIVTLNVSPTVTPSITINGNTIVTPGQSTLLTAIPVNGGTAPRYQWEDSVSANGWKAIGTATTIPTLTFKPAVTGHKLRCTMKSNASCLSIDSVTSNPLTFTVQAVTAIDPVPSSEYGIISYPNPAYSTFTIDKLRIGDLWQTLEIKDNSGHQIMMISARNTTTIVVPVSQLPAGFYIAILRRKSGESVYLKFLKI